MIFLFLNIWFLKQDRFCLYEKKICKTVSTVYNTVPNSIKLELQQVVLVPTIAPFVFNFQLSNNDDGKSFWLAIAD